MSICEIIGLFLSNIIISGTICNLYRSYSTWKMCRVGIVKKDEFLKELVNEARRFGHLGDYGE